MTPLIDSGTAVSKVGLAVRVTWLPCGYACEHVGGHEIEPASSVTVALPDPVFETASV